MSSWEQRPIEIANLLNPAFCSILLSGCISAYQKEKKEGLPYPLSFLILPLILYKPTRDILPRTSATKMHMWLQDNPEVQINFSSRVHSLIPYTKEAILFGMNIGTIEINKIGNLVITSKKVKKPKWADNSESITCIKKANFIGKWLSQAGTPSSIYIMWGIRI